MAISTIRHLLFLIVLCFTACNETATSKREVANQSTLEDSKPCIPTASAVPPVPSVNPTSSVSPSPSASATPPANLTDPVNSSGTTTPGTSSGTTSTQGTSTGATSTQGTTITVPPATAIEDTRPLVFDGRFISRFLLSQENQASHASNDSFIKQLYTSLLMRTPDPDGLSAWKQLLSSGKSRQFVVDAFLKTSEFKKSRVQFFYQTLLKREASANTLLYWLERMEFGLNEQNLIRHLLISAEFTSLHLSDSTVISALFDLLLGRSADSMGLTYWSTKLAKGSTRSEVINLFLRSSEFSTQLTLDYYRHFLGRSSTPQEANANIAIISKLLSPVNCTPHFEPKNGWLDGDAGISLKLDDNRTLWLFGDTSVTLPFRTMVGNSLGISSCDDNGNFSIEYFWDKTAIPNPAFLNDSYSSVCSLNPLVDPNCYRFWFSGSTFLANDTLYFTTPKMANTPAGGSLGFRQVGQSLWKISNPSDSPDRWRKTIIDISVLPGITTSVSVNSTHAYFFSNIIIPQNPAPIFQDVRVVLSRVSLDKLDTPIASMEYFAADRTWKKGLGGLQSFFLMPSSGADQSNRINYNQATNQWEAIAIRTFTGNLVTLRTAPDLTGPWSEQTNIYSIPERDSTNTQFAPNAKCYMAMDHLESNPDPSKYFLISNACVDSGSTLYTVHFALTPRYATPLTACTGPHEYLSTNGLCTTANPTYWCYNYSSKIGKFSQNPTDPAMTGYSCQSKAFAYLPSTMAPDTQPLYAMDGVNNPIWTNHWSIADGLTTGFGMTRERTYYTFRSQRAGTVPLVRCETPYTGGQQHTLALDNCQGPAAYGYTIDRGILGWVFPK